SGVSVDWSAFSAGEPRRRLAIPAYPFERQRYWIETSSANADLASPHARGKRADIADWFYLPAWEEAPLPPSTSGGQVLSSPCLLFLDEGEIGQRVASRLEQAGAEVISVQAGDTFEQLARN